MKKSETRAPVKKLHLCRESIRTGIRAGFQSSANANRSMTPDGGSGIAIVQPPDGAGGAGP